MKEEFEIIKNFIIDNNIISIIIPISIPFILFHFVMNIFRKLSFNQLIKNDNNEDEIEIIDDIPDIVNNDVIMSNNQFIKF